ncbi:hypothetical protein [Paenibacillus taiwanensis]|uniref:hypothetical protein n=1 Tax=Paenibacillus taiwanensis TaxID=401638 RepID=UPI0003FCDFDE|nr:hypothetical protein [Paenibacillus taiwanensis]
MSSFMQLSFIIQWVFILLLLFSVTYLIRNRQQNVVVQHEPPLLKGNSLEVGSYFPRLAVTSMNNADIQLRQTQFNGSILLFSVSGCSGCQLMYPKINNIAKHFSSYQVLSVMIGPKEDILQLKENYEIEIPIHQIEMNEMNLYSTFSFPFCYILSQEGMIIGKGNVQDELGIEQLLLPYVQTDIRNEKVS